MGSKLEGVFAIVTAVSTFSRKVSVFLADKRTRSQGTADAGAGSVHS